ncbi:glycerophosphocholine phosphodiesterase GPCPD1-like isoform X2 [Neocloeon triangulifer]|uniref:glycerophosphocholine phosphodiesterase GPCPD1-like isoform X2 n=1 Tax=Neocloeon triangulifer TaxID=2078957 RepID=UPI00286F0507|nr:glycerophosphocholine phosphodiesterase GPCPD1-like isoform X2 [Neocloeon triangulifer]
MGDNSGIGEWQFCVRAVTEPGETLAVIGECPQLGQWKLQGALDLQCGHEGNVWRGTARLPRGKSIAYRYLVCVLVPSDGERLMEMVRVVKRWETHPQPRVITQQDSERTQCREAVDEFGLVGNLQHVERGWLTAETVIQLKIFGDEPIKMWKRRLLNKQVLVKVTPVNLVAGSAPERLAKAGELSLDESMDTLELSGNNGERSSWPITELSVMDEDDCEFRPQEQFGRVYKAGDFFLYQIQVLFADNVAYLVDFYARSQGSADEDVPTHVGFSYILPSVMKASEGQAIVPITGLRHQPIGQLTVEYLKVAPMANDECNMKEVYSRYWSHTWCGLDVGHRGAGNSFKMQKIGMAEIRENTIASLTQAARHGADFVEFDVQLSRDLVPVIYHDFHVIISMKQKSTLPDNDLLTLPVKDLTLQQLHLLKVYHLEEGKDQLKPRFFDEDLEDHQPFPTLRSALEKLDEHVGFNIEIKWTMQLKDGTYELYHPFDLNLYLDIVLECVLKHGGHRKIIFSCFHPDICTMIRLKQNKYPVMFLTQGATSKYPKYNDPRCHDIHGAIYFTKAAGILGVNAHTEDLLRDPSLVQAVRDAGLVLFCWGDDNNDANTIRHLKALGLHGVIYDKIDQLACKEVKESIFLVEARGGERQKIAALGIQSLAQSAVESQGCGQESDEGPILNLAPTTSASGSC